MTLLEVKNLSISFGGLRAVDDFNISIKQGCLYGLIGPNGAGKTTVFNLLTGVYKPNEGIITLGGKNITGKKTIEIDGENYLYNFKKSGSERGTGYNGIHDGILYIKGQTMKADSDAKYEAAEWEGNDYLVNTSGKIQKSKKNIKDADDYYYCTDSDGVITYKGTEKYEN